MQTQTGFSGWEPTAPGLPFTDWLGEPRGGEQAALARQVEHLGAEEPDATAGQRGPSAPGLPKPRCGQG